MNHLFESERLLFYEFTIEHADFLFELNSDPEVLMYTGDEAFEKKGAAEDFIRNYSEYKRNGFGRWLVKSKKSNTAIGWCGLKKHSDGEVDLGFRFKKSFWSKGYATEAAVRCLEIRFERHKLKSVIGRSASTNKASIRVLEKIGMQFESQKACEGIEDAVVYRINRED